MEYEKTKSGLNSVMGPYKLPYEWMTVVINPFTTRRGSPRG